MLERFPDCGVDDIELAVNDVFRAFENPSGRRKPAKKAAAARWGKKKG